MPLKPCKECGLQVSDAAKECPHCGYDFATASGCNIVLIAIGVIVPLYLLVVVLPGNCAG